MSEAHTLAPVFFAVALLWPAFLILQDAVAGQWGWERAVKAISAALCVVGDFSGAALLGTKHFSTQDIRDLLLRMTVSRLRREVESLQAALQQVQRSYQHIFAQVEILTQASEAEQFSRIDSEVEEPANKVEVAIPYYEGKAARAGNRTPIRIRRGDWKWSDAEFELVKHEICPSYFKQLMGRAVDEQRRGREEGSSSHQRTGNDFLPCLHRGGGVYSTHRSQDFFIVAQISEDDLLFLAGAAGHFQHGPENWQSELPFQYGIERFPNLAAVVVLFCGSQSLGKTLALKATVTMEPKLLIMVIPLLLRSEILIAKWRSYELPDENYSQEVECY
ncbi:hypothetical protein CF326_g8543 [Tilletia indica]|nr:hypothetical protein CF326_g8543 [Tilletia indica]